MNHRFRPGLPALALLPLLMAACASSPPAAPAPAPALPDRWQAPATAGVAPDAAWWQRFGDPLLPALIDSAQAASPTLAAARSRIEQARASRVAAGAALAPTLDAVASASRSRASLGQPAATLGSLGLQAGWELDLFGANAAARDAAQARLDGAQASWHDARAAVAAEVATSYVALRGCEAQLEPVQADALSREQTAALTAQSAKAGFAAPADAALARGSAAQARALAVNQRAACETLLKSIVELTDLPEAGLRERLAPRRAQLPQAPALAVPALPAALLARRPDLIAAARQVSAAAADRDNSAAAEKPRVTLSGSLARSTLRSGGESLNGNTWSLGPLAVDFPLFDGGRRRAATAAAQAGYDEAVASYRAQVRRALREVETSLVALDATATREADARIAAQDFEASLRATEARQKGGLASLFDLEAARRNALAAQSALIDLQRERAAAWISLYRALGGGFEDTPLNAGATPRP